MSGEVGRCGSETPRLLGGPPLFCTLRAGHDGWHEDGITSWSPRAPIAAARPAAGDTRTDRERLREAIAQTIFDRGRADNGAGSIARARMLADAVLPVVLADSERHARQRAAEELLRAADAEPGNYGPRLRRLLRDRAATLTAWAAQ